MQKRTIAYLGHRLKSRMIQRSVQEVIGCSEMRLSYANNRFNKFYSIFHPTTMNQEREFLPCFVFAPCQRRKTTEALVSTKVDAIFCFYYKLFRSADVLLVQTSAHGKGFRNS